MKFLLMPIFFFRELIFESEKEYDITSTSFNTKKVLVFLIMVLSIVASMLLTWRCINLAIDNIDLKAKIVEMEKNLTKTQICAKPK